MLCDCWLKSEADLFSFHSCGTRLPLSLAYCSCTHPIPLCAPLCPQFFSGRRRDALIDKSAIFTGE